MDHRRRAYLVLMGTCVGLILLAWTVVRLFCTPLAVAMTLLAAPLPPIAVVVANARRDDDPGGGDG